MLADAERPFVYSADAQRTRPTACLRPEAWLNSELSEFPPETLTVRGASFKVASPSEVINVLADDHILGIGQAARPKRAIRAYVLVNNCEPLARSSIKVMDLLRTGPGRAVMRQVVVWNGVIPVRK